MTRLPTKAALAELWAQEYVQDGLCCLCGNSGIIDTRGKVKSAAGVECGAKRYCICPNGRARKRHGPPRISSHDPE